MNRRVFFKYLNYIMTILLITLFIFYDSLAQFRDLFPLSRLSILILWIVGILLSLFLDKWAPRMRFDLYFPAILTLYTIVLLVLLNFLGAQSNRGISVMNPAFWVVVALSLYLWYKEYRKSMERKKSKSEDKALP
ncbi:hypothetical protein [Thermicanus aegyptius]|uniref:hypothetical protein n=1 Tax=Thermicanus aegyptius TaxID=94009 RepID=UPI00048E71B5|nr:hypothetical protein [Thermicanus aegyptius]